MTFDICIYGGTAAGVVAAVTAKRRGKSVVLVEPGRHLGGMTSGGLGLTDFGNKASIGGMARDVYRRFGKLMPMNDIVAQGGVKGRDEDGSAWIFEPGIAEKTMNTMAAEAGLTVLREHRVTSAEVRDGLIKRIELEHAPAGAYNEWGTKIVSHETIEAAVFIDCTYEGDLLARAGVKYTVGRESVAQYGETLNGLREKTPQHQVSGHIDPYVKPGDPSSGFIPFVLPRDVGTKEDFPTAPESGDKRVQAYNFRICMTNDPALKLPYAPPPGYKASDYELLARHVQCLKDGGHLKNLSSLLIWSMVSPTKTDINNKGGVSTDFIGMNWAYPEASYVERGKIWREHLFYNQGLFYFLSTSQIVPQEIRDAINAFGPAKDEYLDTGHWPHQLYVRESRRMVADYVVTQAVCEHKQPAATDSVGLAAYTMDSHNCQREIVNGGVRNEGNVEVHPSGPYPISYRAIVPSEKQCKNLLVPVCLSASHIAYGSIRMEPVFMVLAESAAIAACQSMEQQCSVQAINYDKLKTALLEAGQVLTFSK